MNKIMLFIALFVQSLSYSQVSDDFLDGNLTENPAWLGDVGKFEVDAGKHLHLSAERASGTARLFTLSESSYNTSWEFYIQMNFKPGVDNNVRMYLCADTTDTGKLWGLCLRIGAENKITLWNEPASGNGKRLLNGLADRLNVDTVFLHVKATLDWNGVFQLYSRLKGEPDYVLEGSVSLTDVLPSKYFGLFAIYSVTRHTKSFYFDDFVIEKLSDDGPPESPEEDSPEPLDVIINEVLYQPFQGGDEYVELYNRSDKSQDISLLSIATRNSSGGLRSVKPLATSSCMLQPGDYLVITGEKEKVTSFYTSCEGAIYSELTPMIALSDEGASVVIINNKTEEVIDEFTYTPLLHVTGLSNKKGVSLERKNPEKATDNASNWTSALAESGYGTPGCPNANLGETGNPSGISVVESFSGIGVSSFQIKYNFNEEGNRCNLSVFDISGRLINNVANNMLLGSKGTLTWNPQNNLKRGVYIIYMEVYQPLNGHVEKFKVPVVFK